MPRVLTIIAVLGAITFAVGNATQANACCATSPHLSVNPGTMRWGVGPVGDTGGSSTGTLVVTVRVAGVIVHESDNDGSGVFSGPPASGDVSEGQEVEATAETVVNGVVVDSKTERVHATSAGGCSD